MIIKHIFLVKVKGHLTWISLVLEHVYMRPEVNSNRFEISLRGKNSLWCKLTSLSRST